MSKPRQNTTIFEMGPTTSHPTIQEVNRQHVCQRHKPNTYTGQMPTVVETNYRKMINTWLGWQQTLRKSNTNEQTHLEEGE